MRKALTILLIAAAFIALPLSNEVKAQKKSYSQSIIANPLGLAFGMFNATYEQRVTETNSFTVNGYYWSFLDWQAYGFGGSYRWYLSPFDDGKKILEGFSFGPVVAVGFWSWDGMVTDLYDGGTSINIGAEAAYKWVWGGFVLEPSISLLFNVSSISGLDSYSPFGLGLGLGYAW